MQLCHLHCLTGTANTGTNLLVRISHRNGSRNTTHLESRRKSREERAQEKLLVHPHSRGGWGWHQQHPKSCGCHSQLHVLDTYSNAVMASAPHAFPVHFISLSCANAAPENYDQRQTYASLTTSKTKISKTKHYAAATVCEQTGGIQPCERATWRTRQHEHKRSCLLARPLLPERTKAYDKAQLGCRREASIFQIAIKAFKSYSKCFISLWSLSHEVV